MHLDWIFASVGIDLNGNIGEIGYTVDEVYSKSLLSEFVRTVGCLMNPDKVVDNLFSTVILLSKFIGVSGKESRTDDSSVSKVWRVDYFSFNSISGGVIACGGVTTNIFSYGCRVVIIFSYRGVTVNIFFFDTVVKPFELFSGVGDLLLMQVLKWLACYSLA